MKTRYLFILTLLLPLLFTGCGGSNSSSKNGTEGLNNGQSYNVLKKESLDPLFPK